jgi:hypothetical protein
MSLVAVIAIIVTNAITALVVYRRQAVEQARKVAQAKAWSFKDGLECWQEIIETGVLKAPEGVVISQAESNRLRNIFTGGLFETAQAMEEFRADNGFREFTLQMQAYKAKSRDTSLIWCVVDSEGIQRRLTETLEHVLGSHTPLKQRWEKRFAQRRTS